jgi:hypothetical protein
MKAILGKTATGAVVLLAIWLMYGNNATATTTNHPGVHATAPAPNHPTIHTPKKKG